MPKLKLLGVDILLPPQQLGAQEQAQKMPLKEKVALEKGGKTVQPLGATVLAKRLRAQRWCQCSKVKHIMHEKCGKIMEAMEKVKLERDSVTWPHNIVKIKSG